MISGLCAFKFSMVNNSINKYKNMTQNSWQIIHVLNVALGVLSLPVYLKINFEQ